ncbi:MAG: hypothetical protein OEM82_04610 [Acidobacteriota bacterium]|nr:hypothetical protein [Acidobacteriota bacterium]
MAKGKKRLSKRAKAVKKVLGESKELDVSKKAANLRADTPFTPPVNSARITLAHKERPNKKRG